MNTIGTRLADARQAKHLTMKELSDKVGCGYATIMHYEYDLHSPRVDILADICKVLGVTLDYIVYGDNDGTIREE